MVQKSHPASSEHMAQPLKAHILIFEARFYDGIADMLAAGAIAECATRGVSYERIVVPGALEIPQAFAAACAAKVAGRMAFDGAVVLGCVIRGETAHYDIVCNNANHWTYDAALRHDVPVGNGILTVDTEAQAIARATGGSAGKGGDAARACLQLIEHRRAFWGRGA